jgi:hypothetical protein
MSSFFTVPQPGMSFDKGTRFLQLSSTVASVVLSSGWFS